MKELTEQQIKEFETITGELKELGAHIPGLKALASVEGGFEAIKALPNLLKGQQKVTEDLSADLKKVQKALLNFKASRKSLVGGQVSDDCARHLGAIALAVGVKRGQITGKSADMAEGMVKEILGVEIKTALSGSDIPLPTEYSGQVVELVSQFGAARRFGTVFPLGTGTVKLPRLKTDTAFGLIAGSATVTEVSPQTEWVTFTAEKFGGLVRIPTELEEDSIVPIGQFIARYAARNIAKAEDHNFFVGTGAASGVNGTVKGLAASQLSTGNAKHVLMTAKASPSELTLNHLRAVRSVPDAAALRTSAYYLHPSMEQLLASLNTAGDKPYNPNAQLQNPAVSQPFISGPTLDGFPVRWVDVMQAYTTSDTVDTGIALFGDLSFHYLGVRGGIRFDTSMEAGFATDEILIRALERFTTGLMATGSVAVVQTAGS
jgi:HK97 family phage major capsid protein